MIDAWTRRSRIRVLLCLTIATATLAMGGGSASAAPVDRASDHVALRAFDRYLRATVASIPAARRADERFIASIEARCRGALAPVARRPASQFNQTVVKTFIAESVFDLVLTANDPLRGPLASFTRTISALRWSSPGTASIVAAYPVAARRLLGLGASDLCGDSRAFVRNSRVVPAGTRRWEAKFLRDNAAVERTGFALGVVLGHFHGRRDAGVVRDIARLSKRLTSAEKSLAAAEETRLLNALGVHG